MVYGVTSLADNEASTSQLLQLIVEHWTIESTVHWVRDVVFREDTSRVHVGNIPIGMSLLRGVCLNILATVGCRGAADARTELAANPRRDLIPDNRITVLRRPRTRAGGAREER